MRWTIRPISDPTGFGGPRQESLFTTSWSSAVTLLERELDHLNATDVVLEVDVREGQIRLDGQLRADAQASSNRVRLAFGSKHGDLVYATDRFVRGAASRADERKMQHDWQHNLYAIAKALEALRLVDRYGVTAGQQYSGFKAIGAGRAMPACASAPVMSEDEAWSILGSYQPRNIRALRDDHTAAELAAAWKRARTANHPDRRGGDRRLWDQVEEAAAVLGLAR